MGGNPAKPVVVLGFGAAGTSAVMALREAGYEGAITVVTDVDPMPYSPVLTSYYAGGRICREQCFVWADLEPIRMVDEMFSRHKAVAIDIEAHEVTLDDGCRIGYSKLVIATGAHPVAPGFPPIDCYNPLVLRTMEDAERLRRALSRPRCRRVLVSGTSMVGLKALEACLDQGVQATLLGRSSHIMRNAAHPLVAARFEQLLAERGVKLRLSQTVSDATYNRHSDDLLIAFCAGASPGAEGASAVDEVERFDEVLLAQGVKPNLDFSCDELASDRGLVVDQFMRTNSPDVYAVGDVAAALDVSTGEKRIIGLWQNAVQQGRCAGRSIAAELAGRVPRYPFPGSLPCNTIHVRDILFASIGSLEEGKGRYCELHEASGVLRAFVYEENDSGRQLVGVNVLSVVAAEGGSDLLDCEIGKLRRTILNSYVR